MGGFGALTRAARHPDVFGAGYAASPYCCGPRMMDDLAAAWPAALSLADRDAVRAAREGLVHVDRVLQGPALQDPPLNFDQ